MMSNNVDDGTAATEGDTATATSYEENNGVSLDNGDDAVKETELTEIRDKMDRAEDGEYIAPPVETAEPDQPLPSPEEIRNVVNPRPAEKQRCGGKKGAGMLCCYVICAIILILVVIGLAVGISNKNDDDSDARKSTIESIETYVVDQGVSDGTNFFPAAAQYKAAKWMAEEDEMNMRTPEASTSPEEAYQFKLRYAMAVLYYSTNGDNWRWKFNFLSARNTCAWNGVLLSSAGGFISFGLICNQRKEAFAIYLDNIRMTGTLPEELSALDTLRIVDFNFNDDLGGPLPRAICDMPWLESLSIGYNQIVGQIPACFNNLDKIKFLFLPNSYLFGPIPAMNNMQSLERLFLDDNQLEGDISTHFDNLINLSFVFLEDNKFTGTVGPDFFKQQTKLVQLDVSDNQLVGSLPTHLFEFEDIQVLDFHDNSLSGPLPEFPESNILFLALHKNNFTNHIPANITRLDKLFHLDLSSNQLTGPMISEIGAMANLTYLFLAGNSFDPAPIPESYSGLLKMKEFSVKATGRNGTLPEFISNWTDLIILDLDQNKFEDNIPESYGDLINLEFLLLNDNELSGPVPNSFFNLVKLRAIFLEDNQLTGDLDHICALNLFDGPVGDLDGYEVMVADCHDNTPVQCDCCICCNRNAAEQDQVCEDREKIASLDPTWEATYERVQFNFGNDTRFVDRNYLP